jgi:hypothetical protein
MIKPFWLSVLTSNDRNWIRYKHSAYGVTCQDIHCWQVLQSVSYMKPVSVFFNQTFYIPPYKSMLLSTQSGRNYKWNSINRSLLSSSLFINVFFVWPETFKAKYASHFLTRMPCSCKYTLINNLRDFSKHDYWMNVYPYLLLNSFYSPKDFFNSNY